VRAVATGHVDKEGAFHMFSVSTCCSPIKRQALRVQLKLMTMPTIAAEHDRGDADWLGENMTNGEQAAFQSYRS